MNYNNVKWHMIGRLQKNKVKHVVGCTTLIHSIDEASLGAEIQRVSEKQEVITDILIQVNVSGEQSKAGVKVDKINALLNQLLNYSNVCVKGLMTMARIHRTSVYCEVYLHKQNRYMKS
jgi:uncharacterized pyridoxal phosphate-containing UPF0001 family protein